MPAAIRVAGVSLGGAIDDYLEDIAEIFLRMPKDNKSEIMRCYANDQMRETYRRPKTTRRRAS
jgi:hypothetical protein